MLSPAGAAQAFSLGNHVTVALVPDRLHIPVQPASFSICTADATLSWVLCPAQGAVRLGLYQ